jgi:hypothetical protein
VDPERAGTGFNATGRVPRSFATTGAVDEADAGDFIE